MRLAPVAAIAAALGILIGSPGLAQGPAAECHGKSITARGTPALIDTTAKSRARSSWIKRVRADRRLGPSYAAWLRSKDPIYSCRQVGKLTACEATATPCKV